MLYFQIGGLHRSSRITGSTTTDDGPFSRRELLVVESYLNRLKKINRRNQPVAMIFYCSGLKSKSSQILLALWYIKYTTRESHGKY